MTDFITTWEDCKQKLIKQSLQHLWVRMRDGVKLDTNIYLPDTNSKAFPCLLIRSPYPEKSTLNAEVIPLSLFLRHGYAIIYQYERGRYWSKGSSSFLASAKNDGYDTLDWIIDQHWSNGKVATYGFSSSAENQLSLAAAAHPAHYAAIVQAPGAGIGRVGPYCEQGNIFRGGALQLFFASWFKDYMIYSGRGSHLRPQFPSNLDHDERLAVEQYFDLLQRDSGSSEQRTSAAPEYFTHLPVCDINKAAGGLLTDWDDFARAKPVDAIWDKRDFVNEGEPFAVPILWVFSWYDIAIAPNIALYQDACINAVGYGKNNQHMIIGPMAHCQFGQESEQTSIGERFIGDARFNYSQRYLEWLDHWLKSTGTIPDNKVNYFLMGSNQWRGCRQFPANSESKQKTYFLTSTAGANSLQGDGLLSDIPPTYKKIDRFIYHPQHPVPTVGGGFCCMGVLQSGAWDQNTLEMRNDILIYTSAPLKEALTVVGYIKVVLYIASSARDTDFTLKLLDVYPDGRAYNLDDTIMRARYREGYNTVKLMEEGGVYQLSFPPMITANTFNFGHSIRLEVSSSNFPRYERNLNTGGNNYDESDYIVAENMVFHSQNYPSKITMSVL